MSLGMITFIAFSKEIYRSTAVISQPPVRAGLLAKTSPHDNFTAAARFDAGSAFLHPNGMMISDRFAIEGGLDDFTRSKLSGFEESQRRLEVCPDRAGRYRRGRFSDLVFYLP